MGCDIIVIDVHAVFSLRKIMFFDEWDAIYLLLMNKIIVSI